MTPRFVLQGIAAVALSGAAITAHAALQLSLTGFANGSVDLSVSAPAVTARSGAFVGSLSGAPGFDASPFYTYCVELVQSFSWGSPLAGYSIQAGEAYFDAATAVPVDGSVVVDRLGKLFTSLGGVDLPTSATQSAAIQLAVWESIYETTTWGNVTPGGDDSFDHNGSPNAAQTAVIDAANGILANAALVTQSQYSISVLKNANKQDFLLIQRVPEPASLALVAMALAGLGWSRRRSS